MYILNQKHLLFITPAFPKDRTDSNTVTYFCNYLIELKKSYPKLKISVISLHYPFIKKEYKWKGIDIYCLGGFKVIFFLKPLIWLKAIHKAYKINTHKKISLIHSLWLTDVTLVSRIISKLLNVNLVSTIMGTEFYHHNKYINFINLEKLLLVSVSNFQNSLLKKSYPNLKTEIIPWGISNSNSTNNLKEVDILFVGYFNDIKNLPLFFDLSEDLLKYNSSIKITAVGEFFYKDEWEKYENKKALLNSINFTGVLKNEEVISLMKKSKILVHTSDFESLGYVFLEALSCGMYIVSKKVGVAESSDRWHICSTKQEFVLQINHILNNYKKLDSKILYPIEETIKQYASLYKLD